MRKISLCMMAGLMALSLTACNIAYVSTENQTTGDVPVADGEGVLRVCYTDERYKDFFEFCEKEYERLNSDIDVVIEYRSENTDYTNKIISDSYNNVQVADVYMLSDYNLANVYLAGVAMKNSFEDFNEDNYCKTALNACSYGGTLVAYPLSYDTTYMLYRSDILSKEDISTFGNLILFSDTMETLSEEHPEIQALFSTDLNDIFLNYGYIGAGINVGGETGIDTDKIEIATTKTLNLFEKYQAILKYYAVDDNTKYSDIFSGFTDGKYASIIATTTNLSDLKNCELEYSITEFPNLSNVNKTSPLSLTKCVVVNPYADDTATASDFARFVTFETANYLYEYSETLSARRGMTYENSDFSYIYNSYEKASIKNKLMYGEQLYPLLEIAMHNIIEGNAADEELKKLEEHMKTQIN